MDSKLAYPNSPSSLDATRPTDHIQTDFGFPAEGSEINKIVASASKPLAEAQSKTVKDALERQIEDARDEKLPSANAEAHRIISETIGPLFLNEETMQVLIGSRDGLAPNIRNALIESLTKVAACLLSYAEDFAKPTPKRLTQGEPEPASRGDGAADSKVNESAASPQDSFHKELIRELRGLDIALALGSIGLG